MLRDPRRAATAIAAKAPPPAPITPIKANWLAPVNMREERRVVSRIEKP